MKHSFRCDLHSDSVDTDLRLMRYFVAVAEELNFTRAATRLHMTQQPLSAAIRRLETELGVDLFYRTTRHVELTDAGSALLEPARAALQAADDAYAAARAAGSGIAGDLRFGLSTGARYGLEPLFAALAQKHPAVHLHTRHDSAGPLIADLYDGRLDAAVIFSAQIPAPALARSSTTPGKAPSTPKAASGSPCAPRSTPPTANYDFLPSKTRRSSRSILSGATSTARFGQRWPPS